MAEKNSPSIVKLAILLMVICAVTSAILGGVNYITKDRIADAKAAGRATIMEEMVGGDMSKVLPLGKYIVTEVETPAGYVCDPKEYEAELVFADNQTAMVETTVEIENAYLPAPFYRFRPRRAFSKTHLSALNR